MHMTIELEVEFVQMEVSAVVLLGYFDAKDCTWFEMARAGVWYTNNIRVEDCTI